MFDENSVQLVGRVTKDVEIRHTQSGQSVANFTVATNSSYLDKSGTRQKRTEWNKVTVWGKLADACGKLSKGAPVKINGSLQTRQWEDRDGNTRYTTEVVARLVNFLAPLKEQETSSRAESAEDEEQQSLTLSDDDVAF